METFRPCLMLCALFLTLLIGRLECGTPKPWHRPDPNMPCFGEDDGCCTPVTPCDEGQGDCDTGHDCKTGLKCGYNNCVAPKSGQHWYNAGDDCCTPNVDSCDGGDDCCTSVNPCDEGEGDCDWNFECRAYLICGKNNCRGDTFESGDDCCMAKKE